MVAFLKLFASIFRTVSTVWYVSFQCAFSYSTGFYEGNCLSGFGCATVAVDIIRLQWIFRSCPSFGDFFSFLVVVFLGGDVGSTICAG